MEFFSSIIYFVYFGMFGEKLFMWTSFSKKSGIIMYFYLITLAHVL